MLFIPQDHGMELFWYTHDLARKYPVRERIVTR